MQVETRDGLIVECPDSPIWWECPCGYLVECMTDYRLFNRIVKAHADIHDKHFWNQPSVIEANNLSWVKVSKVGANHVS